MKKILIAGGGPAGIIAAITSARRGNQTEIWESGLKIGRKIAASGGGRCNLGNTRINPARYFSRAPGTCAKIINLISPAELRELLKGLGIETAVEEGRIFPKSFLSSSVNDALNLALSEAGVRVRTGCRLKELKNDGKYFSAYASDGKRHSFDKVLVAAGSPACPKLGSGSDGYRLAGSFGHSILPVFPALCPVLTVKNLFQCQAGLKIKAGISLDRERSFTGDVIFMDYGLTGSAVFDLTVFSGGKIASGGTALKINFLPEEENPGEFIKNRIMLFKKRKVETLFYGLFDSRLAGMIIRASGLNPACVSGDISEGDRIKLTENIISFQVRLTGLKGFDSAQAASGGISLPEINPATMESRRQKNLYFAGELLDITGVCGGYNMHAALAAGFAAGNNL